MGTGTTAETEVLSVLAPGGMLTAAQIAAQAQLTTWSARLEIGQLESRGLIAAVLHQARWSITPRGLTAAKLRGRG